MARIRQDNINSGSFWDDQHNKVIPHNVDIWMQFQRLFVLDLLPKDTLNYSLLDIGCGQALHVSELNKLYPHINFTGLDLSEIVISKNKKNCPNVNFICCDIEKEDLQETYDYIVSFHTFEHFDDPVSVLNKCLEHAKKRVIICVPYEDAWNQDSSHVHKFSLFEPFSGYIDYKIVNKDKEIFYIFEGLAK